MRPVAKIVKSHGTLGGVLVEPYDVMPEEINFEEPVYVYFDGLPVPFFIQDALSRGSRQVWTLNDVSSLEDAEEMVGREVFLDSTDQIEAEDFDFVGWKVLDRGSAIGTVSDTEPIPGNYCLYVDTPSGTIMVPLHPDLILSADPKSRTLDLDVPSGLY